MRNVVTTIAAMLLLSVASTGTSEQVDGPETALTDAEQLMEDLRLRLRLTVVPQPLEVAVTPALPEGQYGSRVVDDRW